MMGVFSPRRQKDRAGNKAIALSFIPAPSYLVMDLKNMVSFMNEIWFNGYQFCTSKLAFESDLFISNNDCRSIWESHNKPGGKNQILRKKYTAQITSTDLFRSICVL